MTLTLFVTNVRAILLALAFARSNVLERDLELGERLIAFGSLVIDVDSPVTESGDTLIKGSLRHIDFVFGD